MLQELASQDLHAMPDYRLSERGPDHEKEFSATVHLAGKPWGSGVGRSKKEAEQQAAREAFERLSGGASAEEIEAASRRHRPPRAGSRGG
jgi:ribonuclease-3